MVHLTPLRASKDPSQVAGSTRAKLSINTAHADVTLRKVAHVNSFKERARSSWSEEQNVAQSLTLNVNPTTGDNLPSAPNSGSQGRGPGPSPHQLIYAVRMIYNVHQKGSERFIETKRIARILYRTLQEFAPDLAMIFRNMLIKTFPCDKYDSAFERLPGVQCTSRVLPQYSIPDLKAFGTLLSALANSSAAPFMIELTFISQLSYILVTLTPPTLFPILVKLIHTEFKGSGHTKDRIIDAEYIASHLELSAIDLLKEALTTSTTHAGVKEERARKVVRAAIRERSEFEFDEGDDTELNDDAVRDVCSEVIF